MTRSVRQSVGHSVSMPVSHNFLKWRERLHFKAPIEAHVLIKVSRYTLTLTNASIGSAWKCDFPAFLGSNDKSTDQQTNLLMNMRVHREVTRASNKAIEDIHCHLPRRNITADVMTTVIGFLDLN